MRVMSGALVRGLALAGTAFAAVSIPASAETSSDNTVRDRTIGYVLVSRKWSVTQTPDGKMECPNGLNDGNREQFKILFPEGKKHNLVDSQLEREGQTWHPQNTEEQFPFREAGGKIADGLNLDGKTDVNDFTSPDGAKGIDNQMHRALGCIAGWRGPDGAQMHFENVYMQRYNQNRMLLEITDVDDLVNDPDVTLTTYRGLDELMTDAAGQSYISGGTQRADMRWGKQFVQRFKAKIVDGVLTTNEAHDLVIPYSMTFDTSTIMKVQDAQFRLKLTPTGADGIMAGYTDVDEWTRRLTLSWSTHHLSYGQVSVPSLYRAMRRLADGKPDANGQNTAISGTTELKFRQVYIMHPPAQVAAVDGAAPPQIAPTR